MYKPSMNPDKTKAFPVGKPGDLSTEAVLKLEILACNLEEIIEKLEALSEGPLPLEESTRTLTECFSSLSEAAAGLSYLQELTNNPEQVLTVKVLNDIKLLVDRVVEGSGKVEALSYLIAERLRTQGGKTPSLIS